MKKILTFLVLGALAYGQQLQINDFEADVYSKASKKFSKKISLSMVMTGRDVEDESYKVIDALNVVIGSYSIEMLLTSKGKIAFKKELMRFASKKYGVDMDEVYIQQLKIVDSAKVDDIVNALIREGCCSKSSSQAPISYKNKDIPVIDETNSNSDDIITIE